MRRILFLLPFVLALASSCARVSYDDAVVGRFSGSLFVMWVDDGGRFGDGTFVFVPNPRDPLTFTRGDTEVATRIRPELMYTDGGSIPSIARGFNGFAPWGYAPAYMVHDWLFVARHCNVDGDPTEEEAKIANMTFEESALIMAEAIKTLTETGMVKKNDVAPGTITWAVASPYARQIWDRSGECADQRVSDEDRLAAEAGIPGSTTRIARLSRTLPDGRQVAIQKASVVGAFSF